MRRAHVCEEAGPAAPEAVGGRTGRAHVGSGRLHQRRRESDLASAFCGEALREGLHPRRALQQLSRLASTQARVRPLDKGRRPASNWQVAVAGSRDGGAPNARWYRASEA